MAKFKFNMEVGMLYRTEIRRHLKKLKTDLEYKYDGDVIIEEDKNLLDSAFFVRGFNFPDTEEFKSDISSVIRQLKASVE